MDHRAVRRANLSNHHKLTWYATGRLRVTAKGKGRGWTGPQKASLPAPWDHLVGVSISLCASVSFFFPLEHLVIGLACGPILVIPQHSLTDGIPIPTPQEEGSDGPSLGQVSPTGPTGCLNGGHVAGKGVGGLALGRTGVLRAGGPHVV